MKPVCVVTFLILFLCLTNSFYSQATTTDSIPANAIELGTTSPSVVELTNIHLRQQAGEIQMVDPSRQSGIAAIQVNGDSTVLEFTDGIARFGIEPDKAGKLYFLQIPQGDQFQYSLYHISKAGENIRIRKIPLWLSVLPPLIAILLALIFKEVVISLFAGIWTGAFIGGGLRVESLYFMVQSLFRTIDKYVIEALVDSGHMSVIVFSMLIGGMVAIISKNGGMAGVVQSLSRFANGPRSTQFITWLLGVAIFFDDYANTLIVGNTMRSVTDKFRISREKLAYIVDSTAAPVSAIAFITTWIGAELGYIDDALGSMDIQLDMSAYAVFMNSLKYSFYPVLTLFFILMIIYFKKDFGPMFRSEKRARMTGQVSPASTEEEDEPNMEDLSPVKNAPLKWYNAAIPVLTVIFMTIYGLLDTGFSSLYHQVAAVAGDTPINNNWSGVWGNLNMILSGESPSFFTKLGTVIGSSDSYSALLWSSMSGVIMAIVLTLSGRIMRLFDTMYWMLTGFKTMMPALIILTLAWSLAISTNELHTADYLSSSLQNVINPYFFPVIIFALASIIAFSTGSSWSTMAILYPIAIPASYAISQANGLDPQIAMEIMLNVIATVLAASVLGDHCSPISDTTILSSLASDCNHIDHVRTQLPYALTVGLVSMACVGLSTWFGGGAIISFMLVAISIGVFYLVIRFLGKDVPEAAHE